jgi:hypothetical protein
MKKLVKVTLAVVFGIGIVASSACTRSPAYQKDKDYIRDDTTQSYYNQGATASPTERFEAMGQPKKRVAILNFWNDTPVKTAESGTFAAEELKRAVTATRRMVVPEDLAMELSTSDFVQGDSVKVAQLIREGRRLGVGVIVIGRITKIVFRTRGDEVGVFRQKTALAAVDTEIKVFDVAGGREIMATSRSGEATNNAVVAVEDKNLDSPEFRREMTQLALRDAIAKLVPEVIRSIEKMSWQGAIAKIQGTRVYINAGRESGLVGGDILRVLTPGEDIHDPDSGAFLGRTSGQLKGTVEVMDFLGPDGAVAELHTGGNFKEGDLVKLY